MGQTKSASSSERFLHAHADVTRLLNRNRIFIERTKGIGVLSKEDGHQSQLHGADARAPAASSATCARTSRTWRINDFDFKVICAEAGDCYARYMVRMLEMLESLKIVEQAIENIPAGPVNADVGGKVIAARQDGESIRASKG